MLGEVHSFLGYQCHISKCDNVLTYIKNHIFRVKTTKGQHSGSRDTYIDREIRFVKLLFMKRRVPTLPLPTTEKQVTSINQMTKWSVYSMFFLYYKLVVFNLSKKNSIISYILYLIYLYYFFHIFFWNNWSEPRIYISKTLTNNNSPNYFAHRYNYSILYD